MEEEGGEGIPGRYKYKGPGTGKNFSVTKRLMWLKCCESCERW